MTEKKQIQLSCYVIVELMAMAGCIRC